jgi:hypothetical protein
VVATESDDNEQTREWEEDNALNAATGLEALRDIAPGTLEDEDEFLFDLELEADEEEHLKDLEEQNVREVKTYNSSNGGHEEATVELTMAESAGVLELHCAFSRSIYHTCLWLELEISHDYNTSYQPEHFGWVRLRDLVRTAREKQVFGVNNVAEEEGVEKLQEKDIGLSRCYYECRQTEGCHFFAYAERMMACIQLGEFELEEMHQSCGFIMRGLMQGAEKNLGVSLIHAKYRNKKAFSPHLRSYHCTHRTFVATTVLTAPSYL